MTDGHDPTGSGSWLLEPPAPGQIHVHIEVGSDVDLSPEARAAIEKIMEQIQDDEVTGFAQKCGSLNACTGYYCQLGKCTPLEKWPTCLAYVHCAIANLF